MGGTAQDRQRIRLLPECQKTFLLVKPDRAALARDIFGGTGIQLVTDGAKYLGSAIDTDDVISTTAYQHTNNWRRELQHVAQITKTELHATHAALMHVLQGRWTYVMRTLAMPEATQLALDDSVADLLPTFTGHNTALADDELALLLLPYHLSGTGVPPFTFTARRKLAASHTMTGHQVNEIIHQNDAEWRGTTPEVSHNLACREKASTAMARCKCCIGTPGSCISPPRIVTPLDQATFCAWVEGL